MCDFCALQIAACQKKDRKAHNLHPAELIKNNHLSFVSHIQNGNIYKYHSNGKWFETDSTLEFVAHVLSEQSRQQCFMQAETLLRQFFYAKLNWVSVPFHSEMFKQHRHKSVSRQILRISNHLNLPVTARIRWFCLFNATKCAQFFTKRFVTLSTVVSHTHTQL